MEGAGFVADGWILPTLFSSVLGYPLPDFEQYQRGSIRLFAFLFSDYISTELVEVENICRHLLYTCGYIIFFAISSYDPESSTGHEHGPLNLKKKPILVDSLLYGI